MNAELDHNEHAAPTSSRPSYDDVNSMAIFMTVIISSIVTVVIVAAVQGMAYQFQNSFTAAQNKAYPQLQSVQKIDAQKKSLLDAPTPIEAAMENVIKQYGRAVTNAANTTGNNTTEKAEH